MTPCLNKEPDIYGRTRNLTTWYYKLHRKNKKESQYCINSTESQIAYCLLALTHFLPHISLSYEWTHYRLYSNILQSKGNQKQRIQMYATIMKIIKLVMIVSKHKLTLIFQFAN